MTSLSSLKDQYAKIVSGFQNHSNILYTIGFILSILFAISMAVYWFITRQEFNQKSDLLSNTSLYSLDALQSDETIKDSFPLRKKLSDMLGYEHQIDQDITNSRLQRQRLSIPFDNFLNMVYTPSINIWRDPFSLKIDTQLIGKKYIENNPYGDIALIQQWTNFFKDVGVVDSYNTINDVKVGQPETSKISGYFSIPITVQFETPNKRAFLLLVNKISMTAYIQNLSLINQFMYYIWETIKEEKKEVLTDDAPFSGKLVTEATNHDDRVIGYLLHDWIIKGGENKIITQDIIAKSIRKTAGCTNETQPECMYIFRGKMRALPYLAYGVAREGIDVIEGFKFFLKNMPPILSIESFSFEEKNIKKVKSGYKGTISFRIYGKDILPEEIDTISKELGTMCYISKDSLNMTNAQTRVEKNINELGKGNINIQRSTTLNQILNFITKVNKEYPTLTNQKRVVRLFELYRTLKENSLCDIIKTDEEKAKTPSKSSKVIEQIVDFNTMDTKNITKVTIQTGTINNITGSNITIQTGTLLNTGRTIGDGKGKRDQQLANELNAVLSQ